MLSDYNPRAWPPKQRRLARQALSLQLGAEHERDLVQPLSNRLDAAKNG